jgi:hypothetical protein
LTPATQAASFVTVLPSTCPHCGRDAPIVYRGVLAYCTACGGMRSPLTGPSVNLAGKPAKMGAAVATTIGWIVMLVGGTFGLTLGAIVGGLLSSWPVAVAVFLPFAFVSGVIAYGLMRGARRLRRSGSDSERQTVEQALLAMAAAGPSARGGRYGVTAPMAARSLGIPVDQADALLTTLAKSDPDRVAVDVDDQGAVWYRAVASPGRVGPRVRVDGDPAQDPLDDEDSVEPFARSTRS